MELPECELRPNGPKSNYEPSDRSVNASVTCMRHSKKHLRYSSRIRTHDDGTT